MGLQKKKKIRLEGSWDFAIDGGAVGSYALIDVPANFAVQELYYEIETAMTSGGTPTVEIGDGDDPNGYVADFEASMGTPGVKALNQDDKGVYLWDNTNDSGDQKLYSAADTIDLVVGSEALTAGKLRVVVYGERVK